MTDMLQPVEPFLAAIYRSLVAGDEVILELDEVEGREALDTAQSRLAYDLRRRIESGLLIVACDIAAVRTFASSLDASIMQERKTYFEFDECDMSGGHEGEVLSENGFALMALRSRLHDLAGHMSQVRNFRRAEELAAELTQ